MQLFQLEPGLFLWTLICFGVVVVVLQKWALPPLMAQLRERQRRIAHTVAEGERLAQALQGVEGERERVLSLAKSQAQLIVESARSEAAALRKSLLESAQAEAAAILTQASQKAQSDRDRVFRALEDDLAALVCDTTESLVDHAFLNEADRTWTRTLVGRL